MKLGCAQAFSRTCHVCSVPPSINHHMHAIHIVVQKLLLPQKPERGLELLTNCKGSNQFLPTDSMLGCAVECSRGRLSHCGIRDKICAQDHKLLPSWVKYRSTTSTGDYNPG